VEADEPGRVVLEGDVPNGTKAMDTTRTIRTWLVRRTLRPCSRRRWLGGFDRRLRFQVTARRDYGVIVQRRQVRHVAQRVGERVPMSLSGSALLTVFGGPYRLRQIGSGIDQGDVTKCLREITEKPSFSRIVFFGQQPHIIAQVQEPLEEF
jgi:hypothetical protein